MPRAIRVPSSLSRAPPFRTLLLPSVRSRDSQSSAITARPTAARAAVCMPSARPRSPDPAIAIRCARPTSSVRDVSFKSELDFPANQTSTKPLIQNCFSRRRLA
jgi:hypothetical protein